MAMYVCGPTVYDDPHIGHGRFALVFDVLRRYLEWCGNDVVYVSNITDIDDKIIARARHEEVPAADVARRYEQSWYHSIDRLGVKRPTHEPHATDYVGLMVDLIAGLVAAGRAYETGDGVYLATDTVEGYGLLARQPLDSLRRGGGERDVFGEEKRSPLDFALWKKAKPGEPRWPSPWGDGRPGWHTECVVMALDLLGDGFDLHGGGQDLAFPHHENERAQAVAAGREFARHWAHNGFVETGGEKMSKSLGNVTSLTELVETTDPRAYRLLVLRSHYRSPLEVTAVTLAEAEAGLGRLDAIVRRTEELPPAPADAAAVARFRQRMDDDLDTPGVVADVFDLVRQANTALDEADVRQAAALVAAVRELTSALGLELGGGDHELDRDAAELVVRRDEARAGRDYTAADAIRAELEARGWVVEDTPSGTRVHRRTASSGG